MRFLCICRTPHRHICGRVGRLFLQSGVGLQGLAYRPALLSVFSPTPLSEWKWRTDVPAMCTSATLLVAVKLLCGTPGADGRFKAARIFRIVTEPRRGTYRRLRLKWKLP